MATNRKSNADDRENAEKLVAKMTTNAGHASGAKAHVDFAAIAARLKSCPVTKRMPGWTTSHCKLPVRCKLPVHCKLPVAGSFSATPPARPLVSARLLAASLLLFVCTPGHAGIFGKSQAVPQWGMDA